MPGFQFLHFDIYARQCPAKSRKEGRTAAEVLDENERKPGNMPHVKRPHAPKLLYGVSIDEVRKMHDEVENATTTLKNGKTRKIRKTQNTLATCIMSYPVVFGGPILVVIFMAVSLVACSTLDVP
jgi:hypothetical protein